VAKLADAQDLKSWVAQAACGFDPRPRQPLIGWQIIHGIGGRCLLGLPLNGKLSAMLLAPGASRLKSFLEHPARPAGTLRYHELQGLLFTIASAPETVPPSEWMPMVFDDQDPGYENIGQAEDVIGELMVLFNSINEAAAANRPALPADCVFRRSTLANLEEHAPIAEWSRGFLRGHRWLVESWGPYVPEDFEDEFWTALTALSFFSSPKLAAAFAAASQQEVPALAKTLRQVFPAAVAEYSQLGRLIRKVLVEDIQTEPLRTTKIGRNDPCPCGSGRKHKKCCGAAT
jgi:uncharacterized protein